MSKVSVNSENGLNAELRSKQSSDLNTDFFIYLKQDARETQKPAINSVTGDKMKINVF